MVLKIICPLKVFLSKEKLVSSMDPFVCSVSDISRTSRLLDMAGLLGLAG